MYFISNLIKCLIVQNIPMSTFIWIFEVSGSTVSEGGCDKLFLTTTLACDISMNEQMNNTLNVDKRE